MPETKGYVKQHRAQIRWYAPQRQSCDSMKSFRKREFELAPSSLVLAAHRHPSREPTTKERVEFDTKCKADRGDSRCRCKWATFTAGDFRKEWGRSQEERGPASLRTGPPPFLSLLSLAPTTHNSAKAVPGITSPRLGSPSCIQSAFEGFRDL